MFSIYLPAVSEAAERERLATQENIRGTETLLLVEESVPLREAWRKFLKGLGCTVLAPSIAGHCCAAHRHPLGGNQRDDSGGIRTKGAPRSESAADGATGKRICKLRFPGEHGLDAQTVYPRCVGTEITSAAGPRIGGEQGSRQGTSLQMSWRYMRAAHKK